MHFDFDKCDIREVTSKPLLPEYFAEGITRLKNGTVYQLTWKAGKVHQWSLNSGDP